MLFIIAIGLFGAFAIFTAVLLSDLPAHVGELGSTIAAISSKQSRPPKPSLAITMRDFLAIRTGMEYSEVAAILGPGSELSRSELAGYRTVMYGWKNRNGSNMNVMLQDGRVVSKAQFGLR